VIEKGWLGVSDMLSLLGLAISIGFALALRELYEDVSATRMRYERSERGDIRFLAGHRLRWDMILMRIVVRVGGSCVGAWMAALTINILALSAISWLPDAIRLPEAEWFAAGLGGAFGWRLVDAIQFAIYERLAELAQSRNK